MDRRKTVRMARIGLCAALISVCAWICIPAAVPFTLQSFAVLLTGAVLKGWDAPVVVLIYLGLGLVGLPVFSGMRGGIGMLLSPTGGFLIGFFFAAVWMAKGVIRTDAKGSRRLLCMAAAQMMIYLFGVVWFAVSARVSLSAALAACVAPYLLPDAAKLFLAFSLANRLRKLL